MTKTRTLTWLLAAAVSVTTTGLTLGQYRTGSDGRALDANNRIGSGGINESAAPNPGSPYMIGNQIVTGNVTGGREFRGFVPYSDPTAFRGPTAGGLSDRFIRSSAGVPAVGGVSNNNASMVQPFFGDSRAAPPPPGFVQQSPGGGYVPAPVVSQSPSDLRLGRPLGQPSVPLPAPGQLVLPGPVDPSTQQTSVITASPLYGVRQWNMADLTDQAMLAKNLGMAGDAMGRSPLDQQTLQRLRDELQQATPREQTDAQGSRLDSQLPQPMESPQNQPLSDKAALQAQPSASAISAGLGTGEGSRQRLLLASPAQQSSQYAELERRLERYRKGLSTPDVQANQEFARQMRLQKAAEEAQKSAARTQATEQPKPPGPAQPGQPPGGMRPPEDKPAGQAQAGALTEPGKMVPGSLSTAEPARPRPLQIRSLYEGVQAKGLADVLKEAEDLLKAGRYNSALEQYELAEQVAPNNPLMLMGRAIAELGQSYYTRSETHLRQAFMTDQALLMGQYDLRALLGQDRLEFLVRDLKEIAKGEQKQSRPVFLLAFIAYNTGNERRAAAYLDLAEKRAGGADPLYQLVRKHWALPSDQDTAARDELNK